MNRPTRLDGPRKPTNVTLNADLVAAARELGINVSEACQSGLEAQVKKARDAAWKEANREALDSSNEYVRKHGLPLARYRDQLWRS